MNTKLAARKHSGFTIMELLVVVAIVGILAAVAFVGVINYRRGMKQLELDKTAQELFIAAQNHLTMAESQGIIGKRTVTVDDNTVGKSVTRNNTASGKTQTYHYFVVDRDHPIEQNTVLYDMLPRYSIDETVRSGKSYVIEYVLESATVTNVFYSDYSDLSKDGFLLGDYDDLFTTANGTEFGGYWGSDEENSGAPGKRLDGFRSRDNIIGWYGGEDAESLQRVKLYKPKVEIINDECLAVKVSFTSTSLNKMTKTGINAYLKLSINGLTSGNSQPINFSEGGSDSQGDLLSAFTVGPDTYTEVIGSTSWRYKLYLLDDITQKETHFSELWCEGKGDKALIPGEDITATAQVYSNSVLANLPEDTSNEENSLFNGMDDDSEPEDGVTPKKIAQIKYARHLENLDPAVSGYDLEKLGEQGAIKAKQVENITWVGDSTAFLDRIVKHKARNGTETKASDVTVYLLGETTPSTQKGTFVPVNPEALDATPTATVKWQYDGDNHSISTVTVNTTGSAGLFKKLTDGMVVKNLELKDCDIKSSGTSDSYAGALVGETKGAVRVENVLAHNSSSAGTAKVIAGNAAGGLIGKTTKGDGTNDIATIDKCAAAIVVEASGTSSVAGGLIGSAEGATVSNSYAAGHTTDGKYATDSYNVSSASIAGGFIGEANGTTIQNCYSTCSALGATVGGFVGSVTGGSITNSYCTGLVDTSGSSAGAFIGANNGTSLVDETNPSVLNYYYDIVNYDVEKKESLAPVGNQQGVTNVVAFDSSTSVYQEYFKDVTESSLAAAEPYDGTLNTLYGGKYPFKSAKLLGGNVGDNNFVTKHYGDWPSYETFVVNTKSS